MVDQLASEYASQPVIFLEQSVDVLLGDRYSRYQAARGAGNFLPLGMTDSGQQSYAYNPGDETQFYSLFKNMVEAERSRPPQAKVTALMWRVTDPAGDHLRFQVTVKNLCGTTFYAPNNGATVHAIVYEDVKAGLTSRFVRAAVPLGITTPLADQAEATYTLDTPDLMGVDWTRLHGLALVDYRPGGSSGLYDLLQAGVAVVPGFAVQPGELSFMVDAAHPVDQQATLSITGSPATLTWSAVERLPWLSIAPTSGLVGAQMTVKVDAQALEPGEQDGAIDFTATGAGLSYTQSVPVAAFYAPIQRYFLPLAHAPE